MATIIVGDSQTNVIRRAMAHRMSNDAAFEARVANEMFITPLGTAREMLSPFFEIEAGEVRFTSGVYERRFRQAVGRSYLARAEEADVLGLSIG